MRKKNNVVLYILRLILRASKGNINFYFRLRSACSSRSIGRREASIYHGHWRSGGLHASSHPSLLILTGLNYCTTFHSHYLIFSSQWPLRIICDTYHLTCFDAEWMHWWRNVKLKCVIRCGWFFVNLYSKDPQRAPTITSSCIGVRSLLLSSFSQRNAVTAWKTSSSCLHVT